MRSFLARVPHGAEPTDPSPRFLTLVYLAIALTFALILVGGVVRISDSGLGCGPAGSGTEGWPLCGGRLVPVIDTNMIIEYAHRVLAAIVALLIAAVAFLARRRHRDRRALVQASGAALGLVLVQAALGGLTVEKGLKQELVTVHLGIAMLQVGLLMLIARLARPAPPAPAGGDAPRERAPSGRLTRALATAALVAVLATIVAGGYMSASQLRGTGSPVQDVHTACGTDFPSCGGEAFPFGRSRELDIHLTHRAFMYVASALVIALFVSVLRDRRRRRRTSDANGARDVWAASGMLALLFAQVFLGALNVWLGEHAWLVVAHLGGGTALWASLVYLSLFVLGQPRPVAARERRGREVEAVPA